MTFEEMLDDIERQAQALNNWMPVLNDKVAPLMLRGVEERFSTESGPDGSPWSSGLVETGELRASYSVIPGSANTKTVGPVGERNETIAAAQEGRGNVITGWTPEMIEDVDRIISERLDEIMGS